VAIIRDLMSTDLKTVTLKNNVFDVAMLMKKNDIGFVPVVESGKVLGVITDRDLVVRCIADKKTESTAVQEVMSTELMSTSPDSNIEDAAKQMANHKIRRLLVIENGNLVGVVALADLAVRKFSDEKAGYALSEISENVNHSTFIQ